MKYLLIIYFSASTWGLADVVSEFPNKETCYEALTEVKARPEKYHIAYCKPIVKGDAP